MTTNTSASPGSRRLRFALGILGGLIFLTGLLTVLAPSGGADPLRAAVAVLGNDYVPVAILGALALLLGLTVVAVRGRTGLDQAAPPPPELIHPVARHGESIDAFLAGRGIGGGPGTDSTEEIRSQLRAIAITTVMRSANCSQAEAQERVETGAWTDEVLAANFLAGTEPSGLGARLKAALTGTTLSQQAARATAVEIAELDAEAGR